MTLTRINKILFYISFFTTLLWTFLWGKNIDHKLGDADLVRDFQFAAHNFLENGFKTFGLPVYKPGLEPYTHLTPGPEFIQIPIAFLQKLFGLNEFIFHSFFTAILSIFCILWGIHSTKIIYEKYSNSIISKDTLLYSTLLLLTTSNTQVFAPHPFCLGMSLSDAFIVWLVALFAQKITSLSQTIILFSLSVFIAFWMGLMPAPSAIFWSFAGIFAFSSQDKQSKNAIVLFISLLITGIFAIVIKLFQNKLYFGNWDDTLKDALNIFIYRQGFESKYSFPVHLAKIAWRGFYLFGFAFILIAFMFFKNFRPSKIFPNYTESKLFLFCIVLAGLGWHLFMRNHSFHHIYILRSITFPIVFLSFAIFNKIQALENNHIWKLITGLLYTQLFILWAFVLIPSL